MMRRLMYAMLSRSIVVNWIQLPAHPFATPELMSLFPRIFRFQVSRLPAAVATLGPIAV